MMNYHANMKAVYRHYIYSGLTNLYDTYDSEYLIFSG